MIFDIGDRAYFLEDLVNPKAVTIKERSGNMYTVEVEDRTRSAFDKPGFLPLWRKPGGTVSDLPNRKKKRINGQQDYGEQGASLRILALKYGEVGKAQDGEKGC